MSLADSGFIKIMADPKAWAEIVELSKKDEGVGRELIARIHAKNVELDTFWNTASLRQRIRCFKTESIAINAGNWRKVCKLHKTVNANYFKTKLIVEYDRIINKLIADVKALQDDGGEHE